MKSRIILALLLSVCCMQIFPGQVDTAALDHTYKQFVTILDRVIVTSDTAMMAEASDFAYIVFDFGVEFMLDEKNVLTTGAGMIPETVDGEFDLLRPSLTMNGEIMCSDLSFTYKRIFFDKLWISTGLIYRLLNDSYFENRGERDTSIRAIDERGKDRLALKLELGLDYLSAKTVFTGYALSLSYDIPRSSYYRGSIYDFRVGLNFIVNTNIGSTVRAFADALKNFKN